MNEDEMNKLVDAWIIGAESGRDKDGRETTVHKETWWATEIVLNWPYDDEPELLWRFILEVHERDISEYVAGMLAAGPVEDLLSKFGASYIDKVEDIAQKDERFRQMLCGVWQNNMSDELWLRLQKVQGSVL